MQKIQKVPSLSSGCTTPKILGKMDKHQNNINLEDRYFSKLSGGTDLDII